jgi:competence ComEA-like helix-hairpin-helix protein
LKVEDVKLKIPRLVAFPFRVFCVFRVQILPEVMKSELSDIEVQDSAVEVVSEDEQFFSPLVLSKPDRVVITFFLAVLLLLFLTVRNWSNRNVGEVLLEYKFQVDINKATKAEFQTLPGIGVKLSQNIITHRNSVKRFNNIEELQNVRLIGKKKLAAMKPFLLDPKTKTTEKSD